ncbi:hypothetical protein M440DRAFT_101872 [Trichoderma longibrachiatum ATCC 18648]|uniref:Uncharacterized protein n=1 Tax=Trichoderma longibrachiatum ATCC 18648 TaxID=983965 RepID=A0A2T4BZI5_TRILO|nr:hypothetical protein M440DRAFT_101872 [Trichoderma longibrachiatum ATCC 18648]
MEEAGSKIIRTHGSASKRAQIVAVLVSVSRRWAAAASAFGEIGDFFRARYEMILFVLPSRAKASFGGLVLRQWPPAVFGLARASRRRWLLREHVAVSSDNGGSWLEKQAETGQLCSREEPETRRSAWMQSGSWLAENWQIPGPWQRGAGVRR